MNISTWTKRVITLGVISCGLVWILLGAVVLPLHEQATQVKGEQARVLSEVNTRSAVISSQGDPNAHLDELLTMADNIGTLWAHTGTKRAVYDRITAIGVETGVVVESLEPTRHRRPASLANTADAGGATEIESISYQIALYGSYAEVIEYIRILELDFGLTAVVGFEIRPDARLAPGAVRCSLITRHTVREPDILGLRERTARAGLSTDGGDQ